MTVPADLVRRTFRALNGVVEPLVRAGVANPLPGAGAGLVVLETTGRVSGKTRAVPLVSARVGNRVYASTVRTPSQWVENLDAEPTAGVWINGRRRPATAAVRRGPLTVAALTLS